MKCHNCKQKDCINRLWFEENTYLWVAFRDHNNKSEETEKQILVCDLNDLVELRDEINEIIKQKAGIK